MKNQCILFSDKNYELAFKLGERLKKQNIELKLAKDIVEMFEHVSQNTKAIVIDDEPNNIKYSKLFSKDIGYCIVFVFKEKIYDIDGKLIFEEMDQFISSYIFEGPPKGYSIAQIKNAVEKVFEKFHMIVVNCYGQFVKEILYYMLEKGCKNIDKQHILLIACKLGIKQYHIYEKLASFLKPYFQEIKRSCNYCLVKYDTKKILTCLYELAEKAM